MADRDPGWAHRRGGGLLWLAVENDSSGRKRSSRRVATGAGDHTGESSRRVNASTVGAHRELISTREFTGRAFDGLDEREMTVFVIPKARHDGLTAKTARAGGDESAVRP